MKTGDEVIVLSPHWHLGTNIGGRLGRIVDTTSYTMVDVYGYENSPVKCFRSEIRLVSEEDLEEYEDDETNWKI